MNQDTLTPANVISIRGVNVSTLPAGIFSGLTLLDALYLSLNNKLSSLPAGVFSGLTSLLELSLFRNNLNSLPAGVFSGLSSLIWVNLEDNRLSLEDFPVGTFSDIGAGGSAFVKLYGNLFTPEEQVILKERVKRNTQGRVVISFYQVVWPGQEEQP